MKIIILCIEKNDLQAFDYLRRAFEIEITTKIEGYKDFLYLACELNSLSIV